MRTSKGGRPAVGSPKWAYNADAKAWHWHAWITLPTGRPLVPLDPKIAREDIEGARRCAAETSAYLRANPGTPGAPSGRETVEAYAKRWLTDREGRVNSIRDDRGRMTHHVLPILGRLDACAFNRDDVERLRDDLDRKIEENELSWKTAANVWTLVTSMADDMVNAKKRDLRVRKDNPCREVRAPERGGDKAKQYLFPSEFLAFVSCDAVPLRWRRAVAAAVYTFLRDGELRVMRWQEGDVDLEHGILSVTRAYNRRTGRIKETKTGHTRRFAIEPNLLPLLKAMHEEKCGEGPVVALASERAMARNLRRWLWKAGVRRPELHEGSPTRKPLTWHDLRATGATWMAVRGDDPLKIKQRCGHTTFSTTEIYIREAEAVREGFGDVFPALPACLVDPSGGSDLVSCGSEPEEAIEPKTRLFGRGGRDSNASDKSAPTTEEKAGSCAVSPATSHESAPARAAQPEPAPVGAFAHAKRETDEDAELERRMIAAELAGRTTVADALARELESRRAARAAGNVVPLRRRGR